MRLPESALAKLYYDEGMYMIGRETVLRLLKSHQLELHKLGVLRLAIFGSIARNEAHPGSDVDLLVEFDPPVTFDRYMRANFFWRICCNARSIWSFRKRSKTGSALTLKKS